MDGEINDSLCYKIRQNSLKAQITFVVFKLHDEQSENDNIN